jgi:hypothetical protein
LELALEKRGPFVFTCVNVAHDAVAGGTMSALLGFAPLPAPPSVLDTPQVVLGGGPEEELTPPLEVGGYRLEFEGEDRVDQMKTIRKVECSARRSTYRILDGHHVDMRVADLVFTNGEREVRAMDAGASPPRLQRLCHGLRLSVESLGEEHLVELSQARLVPGEGIVPWSNLFSATSDELDVGAEADVSAILLGLGAKAVGTKRDVLGVENTRSNYSCVVFPPGAHLVPIAAYVLTRIAPLDHGVTRP